MENVRKRKDLRICNNQKKLRTYTSKPTYVDSRIFAKAEYDNEFDIVGVHLLKKEIMLDKPIYIGQAVLDLSKLLMYTLRYEKLSFYEKYFGGEIKVVGGDTDSFFLKV